MRDQRDRVVAACEAAFDHMVSVAREERISSRLRAKIPVIGGDYFPERHAEHMRAVTRAVAATMWHDETASYSWSKPLPLHLGECEDLIDNTNNALKLVGFFGRSLRWGNWDIERHPKFDEFCCGVIEDWRSPMELRIDRELAQIFPPKALAGLATPLHWHPPR